MELNERFAEVIKFIGEDKQQIAIKLDIEYKDIWRHETGKTQKIPPNVFQKLNAIYGINLNRLFCGNGEITINKNEVLYKPPEYKTIVAEQVADYGKKCHHCDEKERLISKLEVENDRLWKLIEGNENSRKAVSG